MARYSSDRSQRARELVRDGKIGGARPGAGRPRKPRNPEPRDGESAGSYLARAAIEHRVDLLRVLHDAIRSGELPRHRLSGLHEWLGIELREAERETERQQQHAELEAMDRDELAQLIAGKLARNPTLARVLRQALDGSGGTTLRLPQGRSTSLDSTL